MSNLLWLRDHCRIKAAWHDREARRWAMSQNREAVEQHAKKRDEARAHADRWKACAEELEAIINARLGKSKP